jgi:hypothetical protein
MTDEIYRFVTFQPIQHAIIDSMYENDSRYLRQAFRMPHSIINDARHLTRVHRKRNPGLSNDLAALDVIRFLRRAAGLPEDEEISLYGIPQETVHLARYAAYWSYIETDNEIDKLTQNTMQAIINGHTDNNGLMDPAPGFPRRPKRPRQ